jgi:hypothetical protein
LRERHGDVLGSCSPRHMAAVASRGQRFARAARGRARLVAIMTSRLSRLQTLSGPPGVDPTPAVAGGSERVARAERGRARLAAIATRGVRPTSGPPDANPKPALAGGGECGARQAARGRARLAAIAARRVRPTSGPPGADPTPAVAGGGQMWAATGTPLSRRAGGTVPVGRRGRRAGGGAGPAGPAAVSRRDSGRRNGRRGRLEAARRDGVLGVGELRNASLIPGPCGNM